MEIQTLCASTDNQQVDDILRGTIGILETLFPGRIRAYYLHGSFADHTGIETSDIDLFLVARGKCATEEREKIQRVMHSISLFSPFIVEVIVLDEEALLQNGHFRVKSASRLVWGEDLRECMPEQTIDQYLRLYARFPFLYIAQMLRGTETLVFPPSYPQPAGDFYGYDQQLLPPGGVPCHNVKKLVTSVCWAATVLIAWHTGKTVGGKRASVQMYREYIHDEWTPFIEEMYEWGNRQWHYLVPQEPKARLRLRELSAQTLAFEKHYLLCYRRYLLAELRKGGESALAAVQQLNKSIYADEECIAALAAHHRQEV